MAAGASAAGARSAGDLLHAPLGDRPRAAAPASRADALAIAPLHEFEPDRAEPAPPLAQPRLDAHGPAFPRPRRRTSSRDRVTYGSVLAAALRTFRPGDEPAWDAFVLGSAEATFFHLSGWKRVIERAFGHRTHYLLAERGHVVTGVLPLTHVKSLLFGSSLISNAFGVQGG